LYKIISKIITLNNLCRHNNLILNKASCVQIINDIVLERQCCITANVLSCSYAVIIIKYTSEYQQKPEKPTWKTDIRGGADKSLAQPGRKQATAPNSGFIQHAPHEAQYIFSPFF
jgi:hypothetical protein